MARFHEPTDEQKKTWEAWVAARPPRVRAVAARFDPWTLYLLKSSNHRVTLVSFDEEVGGAISLKVNVSGEYNAVAFERTVFGIKPDDLEPCDLPGEKEVVGSLGLDPHVAMAMLGKKTKKHKGVH